MDGMFSRCIFGQNLNIMTKYTLTLTTYRTGMPINFEFTTPEARTMFIQMFTNNLSKDGKYTDYITHIGLGERTFAR